MGYGNYNKWIISNPKVNKWYFCSQCGIWNNPFDYQDTEFEEQCKKNLCKRCKAALNRKELFGHMKAAGDEK